LIEKISVFNRARRGAAKKLIMPHILGDKHLKSNRNPPLANHGHIDAFLR
jgi:hypothetical protein